jgi:ATP-dependent Clp protease ATP-binding subunit ClpC
VVDFSNTIIIATSNVGSGLYEKQGIGFESQVGDIKGNVMEELKNHFRPEFINRLDDIIIFHRLSREDIKKIVTIQLERVSRMALDKKIGLEFDDSLITQVAETGYLPEFGARELKRKIKQTVETPLAEALLAGSIESDKKYRASFKNGKVDYAAV